MSIIQVMLHHSLVWRAIHRNIKRDADWHKVGMQIPALLQLLLILVWCASTVPDTITRSKRQLSMCHSNETHIRFYE